MDENLTAVMDDAPQTTAAEGPRDASLARSIEAVILTSDRPLPWRRLAEGLGLMTASIHPASSDFASEQIEGADRPTPCKRSRTIDRSAQIQADIAAAIDALNADYARSGRTFRIEHVAGGYRLMTLPEYAPVLAAFHQSRASHKLSRAAIETLAVIAYRQPITRSHLEAIRGVNCGEVLRSLIERRLISITGRAEELGRPMLYGTTRDFLDAFGLASLKDLPTAAELQEVR